MSRHDDTTRRVYDHSAGEYARLVGTTITPGFETGFDRAVLDAFAADALAVEARVLDVGCGPGRVAAHLASLGLDVSGVDLSPEMVAIARSAHPHLRFDVGSLTALPVDDATIGAAVLWYSIIHTEPDELDAAWHELSRALVPGAPVLVAFQAGDDDRTDRPDARGSATTLTQFLHRPESVAASLERCGFAVRSTTSRPAELAHETSPQAFVVAERRTVGLGSDGNRRHGDGVQPV